MTSKTTRLFLEIIDTPIGGFALLADDDGQLRACGFTSEHARMERAIERSARAPGVELVRRARPQLGDAVRRYFDGELDALHELRGSAPAQGTEGTAFQRAVWQQLARIPCGQTRSYADLARAIGNPAAVRAVGLANGQNPLALVLPCHRVIGSDGSLTGYGGGIERKRWLLEHERRHEHVRASTSTSTSSSPAARGTW